MTPKGWTITIGHRPEPAALSAVHSVMGIERWAGPVATWCLLLGLYLVLEGAISSDEMVAGALAAAVATVLAVTVRRISDQSFSFRRIQWFHLLGQTTKALVMDTLRVAMALIRAAPTPGVIAQEVFRSRERDPEDAANRALLVLSRSIAPNSYVIAVPDHQHELLLHRLVDAQ